ncbi:hypothetical protein HY605_05610 [Candidatus Peregrinibacteria bacterium]|nr:hypothetical protein [Candidatus Peregrinibacteria bacterium]
MMLTLAKKYKNMVVLSTGLIGGECEEFARFFPERYYSLGRAERNIAGAAAGFAIAGKLPVIACSSDFIERAYGVIKNCICEANFNVKFLIVDAALGQECKVDEALINTLLNMQRYQSAEDCFEAYGPGVVVL